jgi:hypothetical protein
MPQWDSQRLPAFFGDMKMKLPDLRLDSQTQSPNALNLASNILLAGVVFGTVSPYWLFLAIPLICVAFTAESKLIKK